jgi:hypothetical protein
MISHQFSDLSCLVSHTNSLFFIAAQGMPRNGLELHPWRLECVIATIVNLTKSVFAFLLLQQTVAPLADTQ